MTEHLNSDYQQFIHLSKYARWSEEKNRRETWEETVDRYITFFTEHLDDRCGYNLTKSEKSSLSKAILSLQDMPSMRCLMTAGEALKRDEIAGFNCAYTAVDELKAFDEIMYVLMCGTGMGFSVEHKVIEKLPWIADEFDKTDTTIIVADSRIGWAKALRELISLLYAGRIPQWDLSKVRPAGTRLKTFGGRSSGPEPLDNMFNFAVNLFKNARGRRLTSLECHDLVCKIAECIVVGGVRRSALISLSDLEDDKMREAKFGAWYDPETGDPHRALANNSAVYESKPDIGTFMKEWNSLYNSKSGERGIFSRKASNNQVLKSGRRKLGFAWGTNPCSEIILRSRQTCNLSDIVCRPEDTLAMLKKKTRIAAILGTMQSTLTSYRYLSARWKKNNEEERLLGVSLTGIMDNPMLNGTYFKNHKNGDWKEHLGGWLDQMKYEAIKTNKTWAKKLGIEPSAAITCVKPSGTVSQLVDSGSGIHPRHNDYYIRRVRGDKKDPLTLFMMNAGFPFEYDLTNPAHLVVFSFPIKTASGALLRKDLTAIDHLELWKVYQDHWCDHKPSITVSVREHEWMDVGAWVYKNFDEVSGVSFLPYSDHIYKQAPYEDISSEEYEVLAEQMPKNLDWSALSEYEVEDTTAPEGELSCHAGGCEL
jgi:ribonucleoside-triphosphate reductase